MFTGLRHRAVSSGDDEDRAIHLRRTGDHVLHEVSVAWAVDVSVVTLFGLILHVRDRDGDDLRCVTHGATLGDIGIGLDFGETFAGLNREDRGRQRSFSVVDVADGAYVDVRFLAFECTFSHGV